MYIKLQKLTVAVNSRKLKAKAVVKIKVISMVRLILEMYNNLCYGIEEISLACACKLVKKLLQTYHSKEFSKFIVSIVANNLCFVTLQTQSVIFCITDTIGALLTSI